VRSETDSADSGNPRLIEKILPTAVASAEAFTDAACAVLFPEEAAAVAKAVDKRRREFATARACARDALARLGMAAVPILPGERGAPRWPAGVVGSITHCAGYRGAAVARAGEILTIGIDAEPDDALPDGVLDVVSLESERAMLRGLEVTSPGLSWDRLLFSAKESVYKAWFPLTRRWLGFEDAEITINAGDGSFSAGLLVPTPATAGCPLVRFTGRWLACRGLVVTAIAIPAPGISPSSSS
jgi:4'-phosphopantetheinyl transferase EntD